MGEQRKTKGQKTYKSLHGEYELLLCFRTQLNVPGHLVLSFIGGRARCAREFGGVAPKRHPSQFPTAVAVST